MDIRYTSNPDLHTILDGWEGTPITTKHRYVNHEFPFVPELTRVLKWKLAAAPKADEKKNDSRRLQVLDPTDFLSGHSDGVLWLGHASFYIRMGGVSVLTDPVYHKLPLVKEWVQMANPLPQIQQLDYLLVSHDHRDHCDKRTLQQVASKFPDVKVHTGLGMKALLKKWLPTSANIVEHGWYQRAVTSSGLTLDYLPTRHWGKRGLTDTNKRLWGAFMISDGEKRVYYGGDSGYGNHYEAVGKLYDKTDVALIGIGAYSPRWFMHPSHMDPETAVTAFLDMKATRLLPMHYGKYDLSDEPPGEPRAIIQQEMDRQGLSKQLLLPSIGGFIDI